LRLNELRNLMSGFIAQTKHTRDPKPWLAALGFAFDPFAHLEASTDPRLGSYLVGHEMFAIAWDDRPALLFAPAGGGKTAMRMYAAHSWWLSRGYLQTFPIPYLLEDATAQNPADHRGGIARAGAKALLIGLTYYPELFLKLSLPQQRYVAAFLNTQLSSPLAYYVNRLRQEPDPQPLARYLERSYRLPLLNEQPPIDDLCAAFVKAMEDAPIHIEGDPFDRLITILQQIFQFRSIAIQIDGVDAVVETSSNIQRMAGWMEWLLQQTPSWFEQQIVLKAFLPEELQPLLNQQPVASTIRQSQIVWTPPLLADVIRRRVYEASEGKFNTLDAVSSTAIRDIELQIARMTPSLPREVIVLMNGLLLAYAERTAISVGQIELEDIKTARQWYDARRVVPGL
jgi:hypothetical protein